MWHTFPNTEEAKLAFIVRAKALMRKFLRSKTWPEKVRAIERMNEASRKAKEGMRRTLEGQNKLKS